MSDGFHLAGNGERGADEADQGFIGHAVHTLGEECGSAAGNHLVGGCLDDGIAMVAAVIDGIVRTDLHLAEVSVVRKCRR